MDHTYDLERFVTAQDDGGTYRQALAELRDGSKRSHWMWFVFPQLAGLGQSPTAQKYAVATLAEAKAYLQHPVLGPRLIECARTVAGIQGRTAREIFGSIDERKLHSSMTLFLRADPHEPAFRKVLAQYFEDLPDAVTDQLLGLRA
ncbi:hypothetical protein BJG92_02071 [Arthrobacter sp. SO5]|uniref:DUF1810 domain-containing protein n=1 Tax=Arthrobacter sp. SO5 TaxID=1897055 RepID=UPI001E3EF0E6|nr:DUF1810 domain-containing protein [Arthrobacter sp. SO5]MCB5274535.1 hypothetical protein [Arthrobacter sp. SO5]